MAAQAFSVLWAFGALLSSDDTSTTVGPRLRLQSNAHRSLADRVLKAEGLDDLHERLDAMVVSDLWIGGAAPDAPAPDAPAPKSLPPLDVPSLERVLGVAATSRLARGHEILEWAILIFLPAFGPAVSALEDEPRPPRSLVDMLYDPKLPVALRERLLGLLVSGAAATVIARSEELDGRLAPWLAMGLADAFTDGLDAAYVSCREVLAAPQEAFARLAEHHEMLKGRTALFSDAGARALEG